LNSELLQEIPSTDPVDQGEGNDWDTVGEPTKRSCSPTPTVEELVAQLTQQTTRVVEQQVPAMEFMFLSSGAWLTTLCVLYRKSIDLSREGDEPSMASS
jgi:hypothetical protein